MRNSQGKHRDTSRHRIRRQRSKRMGAVSSLVIGCLLAILLPSDVLAGARGKGRAGMGGQRGNGNAGMDAPRADHRLSTRLRDKARSGRGDLVDVIITYKARPGVREGDRIRALGSKREREFRNFRIRYARLPEKALNRLAKNPNIEFITRDAPIVGASVAARQTARLPNDQDIDLSYTGWGLGVAVIDSGLGNHIDVWPSPVQFDFIQDSEYPPSGLSDPFGHGTHVAGIIGGDGYYSQKTYRGVAP
ncbi:MAG: hypothetical protein GY778_06245 [bacterium]|nr:hypothetical protein [bacterium]